MPPQRPRTTTPRQLSGSGARPGTVYLFRRMALPAPDQARAQRKCNCPPHSLPGRSPCRCSTGLRFHRVPDARLPPVCRAFRCRVTPALPHSGSAAAIAQRRDRRGARSHAACRRWPRWWTTCRATPGVLPAGGQTATLASLPNAPKPGPAAPRKQSPRGQTRRRRFYRIWPLRGGRPPRRRNARRPSHG